MVIVDAVDFIVNVNRERHAVEAFVAHATSEAARMIGFAHRLQYLRKAKDDIIELQRRTSIMTESRRLPFP